MDTTPNPETPLSRDAAINIADATPPMNDPGTGDLPSDPNTTGPHQTSAAPPPEFNTTGPHQHD